MTEKRSKEEIDETMTTADEPSAVAEDGEGDDREVVEVDALAQAQAERDEYLDHLRRLQAEFDNYRKRVQRESEERRLRAAEAVVQSLLPVIDNLSRAFSAVPADLGDEDQFVAGVRLVADQLQATLEGHGLEAIDVSVGTPFDPTVHEAVLTQPAGDGEPDTVAQVLEPGYLLHGRLLRSAKVIVAQ